MKEIDFLPGDFHQSAHYRRQRCRRIAVMAVLLVAFFLGHMAYQAHIDRAVASTDGSPATEMMPVAGIPGADGRVATGTDVPTPVDRRVLTADRAIRRLLDDGYVVHCLSFEIDQKNIPSDHLSGAGHMRGRLQALAANELAVGILIGRIEALPFCREMSLHDQREIQEAGRRMRKFELTFTVDLNGVESADGLPGKVVGPVELKRPV